MRRQRRILLSCEGDLARLQVRGLHDLQAIHGEGIVERAPEPQRGGTVYECRQLHDHDHADIARERPARLARIGDDEGQ
jgi:hypothetical protein